MIFVRGCSKIDKMSKFEPPLPHRGCPKNPKTGKIGHPPCPGVKKLSRCQKFDTPHTPNPVGKKFHNEKNFPPSQLPEPVKIVKMAKLSVNETQSQNLNFSWKNRFQVFHKNLNAFKCLKTNTFLNQTSRAI